METYSLAQATTDLLSQPQAILPIGMLRQLIRTETEDTFYLYLRKLQKIGVITKIKRGVYIIPKNSPTQFDIAARLVSPSYLSFETALNRYGIISQVPHEVTMAAHVSEKHEILGIVYSYTKLAPMLFFGYRKEDGHLIAYPEKAFLDLSYLAAKGYRSLPLDEMDTQGKFNKTILSEWLGKYPETRQFLKMKKVISSHFNL